MLHGLVHFNAIHEDFKVILLNSLECGNMQDFLQFWHVDVLK